MVSSSGGHSPARAYPKRAAAAPGDVDADWRSSSSVRNRDKCRFRHRRERNSRRGRKEFVLRTVSHNVRNLRQAESIELIISFMRKHRIDVYVEDVEGGNG